METTRWLRRARVLGYKLRTHLGGRTGRVGLLPVRPAPEGATLRLTERCNSRCLTCDSWLDDTEDAITTDRAIRLLEELRAARFSRVRLSGGESLLRGDLFEILDRVGSTWFDHVELATNGLLLDENVARLNDSVIDGLTVSLDGVLGFHDRIRGVDGAFERTIESLPRIRKRVTIAATFTSALAESAPQLVELCREHGWGLGVNLPDYRIRAFSSRRVRRNIERLWPTAEQVDATLTAVGPGGFGSPEVFGNARRYMLTREFLFAHCMVGFQSVFIYGDGTVYSGCSALPPVGSILDGELSEVIASPAYARQVSRMFAMQCPGCTCGYAFSARMCSPDWLPRRLRDQFARLVETGLRVGQKEWEASRRRRKAASRNRAPDQVGHPRQ